MTAIVSVMYPTTDGARFDMDYYLTKHMPMVADHWTPLGLTRWDVLRGTKVHGGPNPSYHVVATLVFESVGHFEEALAQHGEAVMKDVPNYTDIRPNIQVGEVVGGG